MNGAPFKLGTFAKAGGGPFPAIVLGDDAIDLNAACAAYRKAGRTGALSSSGSIDGLLENWDANFAALQDMRRLRAVFRPRPFGPGYVAAGKAVGAGRKAPASCPA